MLHKSNIVDIAEKSGFSITTVSRVLNGKADKFRISKETQQKVKAMAEELNYVPNEFARNLRTGRSKTIALIVPSLKNPFFAEIASVVNTEVRKYNYITLIGDSDDNIEDEKAEVLHLSSRNLDGMIIVPCGDEWEHLVKLQEKGLPLICIDRYFEGLDLSFVSSDNYEGAYSASKYLIEHGHTSIACIQGVRHSTPNKQRVKGFVDAMVGSGITSYTVTGDAFSEQNGYLETKLLLQQKIRPTAIFAFSNTIAMGCIKALKEERIRIPEDISLMAFDENPYLNYLEPPLTCISQPVEDICKIAVKILFSNILERDTSPKYVQLKTQLKVKASVKNLDHVV
ncbi:MAG: LacI family DNA-binding transcriptional regulator [Proteiniphilum sp.]|nr:LacI family DNA-binding transcriptional regulator [Proteiniphilum sp.]MDD4158114.1 LacI family DNA-binding transcriptional regulator [Proteiniphilum sp.]MDD4800527.1 LacI family DNA-binding transcriptional regulator [Proteiniphilum sp.]